MSPTKVAVLGGGVGAIVAAFELTRPELEGQFEVTVYQPGWRLGGKGASGRNVDPGYGKRIEEHGLHVWFGFYENAFEVMDDAYRELAANGGGAGPFKTTWDAFVGCDEIVAFDRQGQDWVQLPGHIDPNPGRPGHGFAPKDFWEIVATVVEAQLEKWCRVFLKLLRDNLYKPSFWAQLGDAWSDGRATEQARFPGMSDRLGVSHEAIHYASGQHLLRLAKAHAVQSRATAPAAALARRDPWDVVNLLNAFRDFIYTHFLQERVTDDPELRFFFTTLDAWASGLQGVVADGVLERGWDCLNEMDLCEWLKNNGANKLTVGADPDVLRSPMLRAIYDLAFAYVDGDITKADASAGTAAGTLLRLLFNHAGSILYKMQAGMGDTVFTPFYLALRQRGVKFRFFHTVTRLGLSGTNVDEIEVVQQVQLAPGVTDYQPLVVAHADDPKPWCWPSEPLWDQIQASRDTFPIPLSSLEQNGNPFNAERKVLRRDQGDGRGDFDQVVLGISIGALTPICQELIAANADFGRALETARTTPTQGFQLWMRKDTAGLGWTHGGNSVAGAYEEPMDTYCDMSHLRPAEDWPGSAGLESIAYFCGVLPRVDGETQAQATQRVKKAAEDFLTGSIGPLWPGGVTARGALDKGLLVGSSPTPNRLDDQYYRANIDGTELYVLTPKGTVDSRLRSEDSGFDNLVLAGDWTRNGIDGGCVESAALSGRRAARKLTGSKRRYVGEEPAALVGGEKPFVEYGTMETAPGPFLCTGGKFLVLVLTANEANIGDLLKRVLTDTATTEVRYRPLGQQVALMIGHIDAIRSTTPKFADRGYAAEWQAALMVPVLTETRRGPVWLPSGLATFMPFLFVDNAISLSGGREIYGLAKAIGKFPYEKPPGDWRQRPFAVRGYGGNFGANEKSGWKSLIAVEPLGRSGASVTEWGHLRDVVGHLFARAGYSGKGDFVRGEVTVARKHIETAFLDALPQLVLKQFRASDVPTMASFRQPGAVHLDVTTLAGRLSQRDWQVTLSTLDSHPIAAELGLKSQTASFAFELEMDFVLD